MGSLFDGISGFPLAGLLNGIETKWVSEIEPFCIKVSSTRFPNAKQLGSVIDINGANIEPVDIITFGSPCQDLSVAGKQLGIHEGQRSNLFFEAIRIIKEMRKADEASGRSGKSIRPRFAVWENVDGARSSNKGEDFRAVLEAFTRIIDPSSNVPMPKKGRWEHNGCIVGDGYSLAWKVLDAQWAGVPQRRKRIYLVADFGSERAGEILLVKSGVSGHFTESGAAREGTAADAERGVGRSSGVRCLNLWDSQTKRLYGIDGCYAAIQANSGGGGRMDGVLYEPKSLMEENWAEKETIGALRAEPSKSANCVVEPVCYALQGNGIDRADTAGCNGKVWRYGEMYTLNTIDRPAVVFPEIARTLAARHDSSPCVDRGQNVVCYDARGNGDGATSPTLTCDNEKWITDYTAICVSNRYYTQQRVGEYAECGAGSTLMARDYKSASDIVVEPVVYPGVGITSPQNANNPKPGDPAPSLTNDSRNYLVEDGKPQRKYIVRRLTPLEATRLQGMPDTWFDGVNGSDSAKYKASGNGLALPCAYDVMNRIARFVEYENATEPDTND